MQIEICCIFNSSNILSHRKTKTMAERFIENSVTSGYFLWIDPDNGTTYDNVVCLLDFTYTLANSTVTTTTMCGSNSAAGDKTVSINFTGQIALDPDTGRISAPDIFNLADDQTTFSWKIGKLTPADGDVTKTGHGFISNYNEDYHAAARGGFGATISVDGATTQVVTGAS